MFRDVVVVVARHDRTVGAAAGPAPQGPLRRQRASSRCRRHPERQGAHSMDHVEDPGTGDATLPHAQPTPRSPPAPEAPERAEAVQPAEPAQPAAATERTEPMAAQGPGSALPPPLP